MANFYTVTVVQDKHIFWYRSDGEHKSTCFRGLWLIQSTMWTGFHVFWARTHCSVGISGWGVVHNKGRTRCHSTVTCSFQNAPQTCVKLSLPHAFPQNLFLTIQAFLISAPVRIGLPLKTLVKQLHFEIWKSLYPWINELPKCSLHSCSLQL